MIVQLRAPASAQELERVLGDPLSREAPISFGKLVAHDEREEAPSEAFEALRQWGVHAHLVPQALGGRLTSFEELLALVRVVSRRDLVLTTGLGSTMLAAIPGCSMPARLVRSRPRNGKPAATFKPPPHRPMQSPAATC